MNLQLKGVVTPSGENIGNILGAAEAAGISPAQQLMNSIQSQSAAQLAGVKAPPPTAANPTAGRTILGLPALDVGMGAVALVGLGIIAKVRHWF